MSDLFHEDLGEGYIQRVFDVMRRASWHRFQALTKRSGRLAEMSPRIDWPENVWMGVSVERRDYTFRIDHLHLRGHTLSSCRWSRCLGRSQTLT